MLPTLFYHAFSFSFFFFLRIHLYFLIPAVNVQTSNPTAEIIILIRMPTNEVNAETETHPVTEVKTSNRSQDK